MTARILWNLPVAALMVVVAPCAGDSGTAFAVMAAVGFANFIGYAEGRTTR